MQMPIGKAAAVYFAAPLCADAALKGTQLSPAAGILNMRYQ